MVHPVEVLYCPNMVIKNKKSTTLMKHLTAKLYKDNFGILCKQVQLLHSSLTVTIMRHLPPAPVPCLFHQSFSLYPDLQLAL